MHVLDWLEKRYCCPDIHSDVVACLGLFTFASVSCYFSSLDLCVHACTLFFWFLKNEKNVSSNPYLHFRKGWVSFFSFLFFLQCSFKRATSSKILIRGVCVCVCVCVCVNTGNIGTSSIKWYSCLKGRKNCNFPFIFNSNYILFLSLLPCLNYVTLVSQDWQVLQQVCHWQS